MKMDEASKIAMKTGLWIRPHVLNGSGIAFQFIKKDQIFLQVPADTELEDFVSLLDLDTWDVVEPDDVMAEFKHLKERKNGRSDKT